MRDPENIKVLVGCETSGIVRNAFLARGFDAWSSDVEPADTPTNRHIIGDIREVMTWDRWDMMAVLHPPCTTLANCQNRWFYERCAKSTPESRQRALAEAADLFGRCLHAPIEFRAIENPVMGPHAKKAIKGFRKWTQTVQPWEFAQDKEGPDYVSKRTCLWLVGLPKLVRTGTLDGAKARKDIHRMAPGPDRAKNRSRSFPGIAAAMADQWGDHLTRVLV